MSSPITVDVLNNVANLLLNDTEDDRFEKGTCLLNLVGNVVFNKERFLLLDDQTLLDNDTYPRITYIASLGSMPYDRGNAVLTMRAFGKTFEITERVMHRVHNLLTRPKNPAGTAQLALQLTDHILNNCILIEKTPEPLYYKEKELYISYNRYSLMFSQRS